MLATKFSYTTVQVGNGYSATITRLSDGATKVFTQASSNTLDRVNSFFDSLTDDLFEGHFPKQRKK